MQAHHTTYEEQVRSTGKKAQKTDEQQLKGIIPGPPTNPNEQRDKEALTNLRKAHSAWDRTKRDYTAVLDQSRKIESTKGSKFEKDIEAAIREGIELDSQICQLETQFISTKEFSNDDIEEGTRLGSELHGLIKSGNKKAQALRSWFVI